MQISSKLSLLWNGFFYILHLFHEIFHLRWTSRNYRIIHRIATQVFEASRSAWTNNWTCLILLTCRQMQVFNLNKLRLCLGLLSVGTTKTFILLVQFIWVVRNSPTFTWWLAAWTSGHELQNGRLSRRQQIPFPWSANYVWFPIEAQGENPRCWTQCTTRKPLRDLNSLKLRDTGWCIIQELLIVLKHQFGQCLDDSIAI